MIIHDKSVTSIELSLFWQNSDIFHTDCFFAKKVNFYRDIFPQKITDSLMGKSKGGTIEIPNIVKDIVSPYAIKFFIKYAPLTFFIKSIVHLKMRSLGMRLEERLDRTDSPSYI